MDKPRLACARQPAQTGPGLTISRVWSSTCSEEVGPRASNGWAVGFGFQTDSYKYKNILYVHIGGKQQPSKTPVSSTSVCVLKLFYWVVIIAFSLIPRRWTVGSKGRVQTYKIANRKKVQQKRCKKVCEIWTPLLDASAWACTLCVGRSASWKALQGSLWRELLSVLAASASRSSDLLPLGLRASDSSPVVGVV